MPLSRRKLRSPQPPGASWLAWPTLQESLSAFPAFGGSFCHETRHLVHQYGPLVTAELRIQTTGELAGEVRVFVAGLQVATIPYDAAGPFRDVIDKLHRRGLPATCRAELDVDAEGHVLLHTKPAVRGAVEPFLPPINARAVDLPRRRSEMLDRSLNGGAPPPRAERTALLSSEADYWTLSLDGQRLGFLESHPYPQLQEAVAHGFPLTCYAILERVPDGPLRVNAALPDS